MVASRGARVVVLMAALLVGAAALPGVAAAGVPDTVAPDTIAPDTLAIGSHKALDAWAAYQAGDSDALREFDHQRDAAAVQVGIRIGVEPAVLRAAWRRADRPHQVALMAAFSQIGTPYRKNMRTPGVGFDCSGLTSWAWQQAGVSLFHQSRTQIRASEARTPDTAQAGDLVYYPGHVMMYLGVPDAIVHSPLRGRPVEVAMLPAKRSGRVKYGDPTVQH